MAIITVDGGRVTVLQTCHHQYLSLHYTHAIPTPQRIDWDNQCFWCGGQDSSSCMKNTYDYSGNSLSTTYGSCVVKDEACIVSQTNAADGNTTKTTTAGASELCELSVYQTTLIFISYPLTEFCLFHTLPPSRSCRYTLFGLEPTRMETF